MLNIDIPGAGDIIALIQSLIALFASEILDVFLSTDAGSIPSQLFNTIMAQSQEVFYFLFILIIMFGPLMWKKIWSG